MESQKLKNKKIIEFIFWILSILVGIVGLGLIVSVVFFFMTLFNPNFEPFYPVTEIPLKIFENGLLELNNGDKYNILIDDAYISFNINNTYGLPGILNFIFFELVLVIAFYIVFTLWKIFRSIRNSLKYENPFHPQNIWRIRKIAIAILFSAFLNIIYPIILKFLWFNDVVFLGKSFEIKLNFDYGLDIFWALIILVVAEIYRIGLEMKKDQELTI